MVKKEPRSVKDANPKLAHPFRGYMHNFFENFNSATVVALVTLFIGVMVVGLSSFVIGIMYSLKKLRWNPTEQTPTEAEMSRYYKKCAFFITMGVAMIVLSLSYPHYY